MARAVENVADEVVAQAEMPAANAGAFIHGRQPGLVFRRAAAKRAGDVVAVELTDACAGNSGADAENGEGHCGSLSGEVMVITAYP